MVPLLIDRWTTGLSGVRVVDDASVSLARESVRALGEELGLGATEVGALAIVVSELARNQLTHALHGLIAARPIERGGVPGVEIVAADRGNGIADPARALSGDGATEGPGLGVGLAGVLRLADEVDFDVRLGEGSCVWARKFARRVPRRREVGIFSRPCDGERVSGDDADFVRTDATLLLTVADGLGHGVEAREAADAAVRTIHAAPIGTPSAILGAADQAVVGTRGAVMTVMRLDEQAAELTHACAGNIDTRVYLAGAVRAMAGPARVLGARGGRAAAEEIVPFTSHAVLVISSDGIRSRVDLAADPELMRRHPIRVAHALVERFGRTNDDATVLVVS